MTMVIEKKILKKLRVDAGAMGSHWSMEEENVMIRVCFRKASQA